MTLSIIGNAVALLVAVGISIPILVLLVECLLAVLAGPSKPAPATDAPRPRTAVLIPAHNEEPVIGQTLTSLNGQLGPLDRLIVIADNCADQTAALARQAGAEVFERHDLERRGKGYALAFAVEQLRSDPPAVVLIIDADCQAHAGLVEGLARTALARGRPVQGVYLLDPPPAPSPKAAVSALAFLVKNLVRPLGMHRLGLPCHLTGAGMAFPWPILAGAKLASGNIVEDMQLGMDLAFTGTPALFCPSVKVTSQLPAKEEAATKQRTRWEHGHLQTLLANGPRLLARGLARLQPGLVGLALDLCVPPLSLLVLLWLAAMIATAALGWWTAWWVPALILVAAGALLLLAILSAWARFGRAVCPFSTLASLPVYLLWKVPVYFAFLFKPQKEWVRTERDQA